MDGSKGTGTRPLGPEAVFAPPSRLAPPVGGPAVRPARAEPSRGRFGLGHALAASALLHGASALAMVALPFQDPAAGARATPQPEAMAVSLVTSADLVGNSQPEVRAEPAPQALAATVADESPPAPAAMAPPRPPAPSPSLSATAPDQPLAAIPAPEPPPAPEPEPAKPAPPAKAPKAKPAPQAKAGKPAARDAAKGAAPSDGGGAAKAGTGPGKAEIAQLAAEWGAAIRARVERKRAYPAAAGGAAGTVKLRITVAPSGRLLGVRIAASSGNAALDRAAVQAVQAAGRFPRAPGGLEDASYSFTLPMRFQP